MKRIFAFCLALVAVFACEEMTPVENQNSGGSITVTPSELRFDFEGGKQQLTLTLKSASKQWELIQDNDWCSMNITSGKASTTLTLTVPENASEPRTAVLEFASPGCESAFVTVYQAGVAMESMPEGTQPGINYNEDGSVTLAFYDKDASGKHHDYAYLIGEFNKWELSSEYMMNWDEESSCWWYTMTDVIPANEYMFQYYLGYRDEEEGRAFADPYSEVIYERADQSIAGSTYPGLRPFPSAAKGVVSAFRVEKETYSWEVPDYSIEDPDDLVIYELHFRDFTATGDINGAMQKLDYIKELGVNAIELMPIHEFDSSNSWGYNPIAFFAFEKSYGTREMYRKFIDECHKRGMAVIVDVVYNHAHENHPMVGLYFNWNQYKPTANNPWFNVQATHPYSVFYDFNHENQQVRDYVKRSLKYLLDEMNIDGFRFDLTKGFTQKKTDPDVTAWGRYDQSRVNILKDYADYIWSVKDDAVVIFEHLSDGDEEKTLADYGIKLWRNMNYDYRAAVNGGIGNFSGVYSKSPFGGFVGYMESHDEERLCFGATTSASVSWGICGTVTDWESDIAMVADATFFVAKGVTLSTSDQFKIRGNGEWNDAYNYGATYDGYKLPKNTGYALTAGSGSKNMSAPSAGKYDIYFSPDAQKIWLMAEGQRPSASEVPSIEKEDPLVLAMRRAQASAAFFLTVPGPKMIWQFGELGYDVSIEVPGRTDPKPLHWEYYDVPERRALYDTYSELLRFRRENPRFFDKDASFSWSSSGTIKTIKCTVDGKSFFVVGNFSKSTLTTTQTFPSSGTWTNWFDSSDTFTGSSRSFTLKAGEFRMFVK